MTGLPQKHYTIKVIHPDHKTRNISVIGSPDRAFDQLKAECKEMGIDMPSVFDFEYEGNTAKASKGDTTIEVYW